MTSTPAVATHAASCTGRIACVAPFDFAHSLAFLRGFSPMVGEQVIGDTSLTKALLHEGQPVVFTVEQATCGQRPALAYRLVSDRPVGLDVQRALAERIAFILGAGEDLQPFYDLAAADPCFARLAAGLRGLHHVKFPSAFEAACWGAINQRVQRPLARRMKDALTHHFGKRLVVGGQAHWAFPGPQALARVGVTRLEELLGDGRKAKAIEAIATGFRDVGEAFLRDGPIDAVADWLQSIHGVGPFTSSFVLFRGLGRFHGQPLLAPRLVAAASEIYGRALSASDMKRLADGYGPWGGLWLLYLWASTFFDAVRLTV